MKNAADRSDVTVRKRSGRNNESAFVKMKKSPKFRKRWFNIFFTILVMIIVSAAMLLIYGLAFALSRTGAIPALSFPHAYIILSIFAVTSVLITALIAFAAGRIPLSPLNRLIDGMHRLSQGDYSVRVRDSRIRIFNDLISSFNTMAEELGHTEMLRADFVNDFSHEFKTPISSIKGFAQLLERGNLSEEQRKEYLGIIAAESERLANLATNVLDLTRLENQNILSDTGRFNLSEQIRTVLVLLDNRIESRGMTLSAEFDEYYIDGNQELLRRVWVNLLDNAIKYSPDGARISVSISRNTDIVKVDISNTGTTIPPESIGRIFGKFYQVDRSHSGAGYGLGLPIVRKTVALHRGAVNVTSENDVTTFSVFLPSV